MFIEDNDLIDVKIYVKKSSHKYFAYTEKEYKTLVEKDQAKCEPLTVKMKELTWGLYNQLQDDAMKEDHSGESKFNYRAYKESKLKKLIKEWDAKGKDGKIVTVSENTISHLAPSIAEAVLRAYDEISFLSEDEEGK